MVQSHGGSPVPVRIRTSRAVVDCLTSMISVVDAVVSPICREPPSSLARSLDSGPQPVQQRCSSVAAALQRLAGVGRIS